ncbi:MAG TPA: trypsin-like peptidase domain-containing protein [Usitatibacter sp.]
MAVRRTHYDVLGVARDASSVDIASAFRDKLAEMKAKPDVLPEAMESLRDAYQTLASPERRAEYDESIAPPVAMRPSRPSRADDSGEDAGGLWPSALKYAIPALVVVLAIWGWKRHKAPPPGPIATVVSVTRIETPADPVPGPSAIPEGTRGDAQTLGSARNAENIFAEISPSIVSVHAADGSGRQTKQGSGVVTGSGRVITNCHVVSGADQITVASGGDTRSASVYVADEELDLCSLDVTGLSAPAVALGSMGDFAPASACSPSAPPSAWSSRSRRESSRRCARRPRAR